MIARVSNRVLPRSKCGLSVVIRGARRKTSISKILFVENLQFESFSPFAASSVVYSGTTLQQCLILLIALTILALIARFINQSIVRPTNEISTAVRKIANGRLATAIPHCDREDEIGEIARSAKVLTEYAAAVRDSSVDLLTDLPMRVQLRNHVQILEMDQEHAGRPAAFVHIDLDGFSEVNSSCGRSVGDRLLAHVADILRKNAKLGDFIARDGPDSFVVVALGRTAEQARESHAIKIRKSICEPIDIDGHDIEISCCIGITDYVRGIDVETMLGSAEQALAEAKRAGPGSIAIYTDELDARLQTRRQTLSGLRFALSHDEIVPYFQPQVDTTTGKLTGLEALVRWNHPEHGVLAPWQFLTIAEEAGLGSAIMDTMMAKSMKQLADWRRLGFEIGRISLNFAALDLRRTEFADRLALQTDRYGLSPRDICIEVLESAMIEDSDDPVSRTLERLSDLGFPIELDDFGTGHAAVSTFNLIDLSGVKIDRSFIARLHERPENLKVVRGMLLIANAMGVTSIAEGVENRSERAVLKALGCDMIQGFLISEPMPADVTTGWLEHYRPIDMDLEATA